MTYPLNSPGFPVNQPGGTHMIVGRDLYAGNIWFVDSGHAQASDSAGAGRTPNYPTATIDYAIGLATASNGDVILVAPGHAETMGTFAADAAGLLIMGAGHYNGFFDTTKPTITFDTTTDEVAVSAANVTLKNLRFSSGVNNLANFIDSQASNLVIEDCDFVTANTFEAYAFINQTTTIDFLTLRRCSFIQPTDPAGTDAAAGTGAIYCEDTEHIIIDDCYAVGQFETAFLHNKTTAAAHVWIRDCVLRTDLNSATILEIAANTSGMAERTVTIDPAATDVTVAKLWGATLSPNFFVSLTCSSGNDGGGGQLGAPGDAAAS